MLQGYHKIFKSHAMNTILKAVYTPEASLGVGDAEYSGSINKKPTYTPPARVAKTKDIKTSEDTLELGFGKQFYTNQFPKNFYLGEGVY